MTIAMMSTAALADGFERLYERSVVVVTCAGGCGRQVRGTREGTRFCTPCHDERRVARREARRKRALVVQRKLSENAEER